MDAFGSLSDMFAVILYDMDMDTCDIMDALKVFCTSILVSKKQYWSGCQTHMFLHMKESCSREDVRLILDDNIGVGKNLTVYIRNVRDYQWIKEISKPDMNPVYVNMDRSLLHYTLREHESQLCPSCGLYVTKVDIS